MNTQDSITELTYFDALRLHFKFGSDPSLIFHCSHVTDVAYQILNQLPNSITVDKNLVLIGAFLHDIGRNVTQGIRHAVAGSDVILKEYPSSPFIESLARVVSCHIGGGIPKNESKKLGLPERDFIPITIEEKIVCYSDKMVDYDYDKSKGTYQIKTWYTFNSVENEVKKLASKLGQNHPSIGRLYKLEKDLLSIHEGNQFSFKKFNIND